MVHYSLIQKQKDSTLLNCITIGHILIKIGYRLMSLGLTSYAVEHAHVDDLFYLTEWKLKFMITKIR